MLKVEKKEETNGRWRRRKLDGRVCGPERVARHILLSSGEI